MNNIRHIILYSLLLFIFIYIGGHFAFANEADELRAKIESYNEQIEQLDAEIRKYEKQLTEVGAEKQTL